MRLQTRGSGSDLRRLMEAPRANSAAMASNLFGDIPVMLIGAHAANAYMPPRHTKDVDFLVPQERLADVEALLQAAGWTKSRDLFFPNAKLGLAGSAWHCSEPEQEIDIITSAQPWVEAAFHAPVSQDQNGARVLPLPFLVLMKLDSARTTDQGDLSRMLGRLSDNEIDHVVTVVARYYDDAQAADDIRQYALIGRWEYETE